MILAGDIGGTKTLLALYQHTDSGWQSVKKQQFASADFVTFDELLKVFVTGEKISRVCIGVAGPVMNGVCRTTNLPWVLKSNEIAQQTGASQVALLNDLAAMSWGVLSLSAENFVELNPVKNSLVGNIAVLAAGTGLGEAMIAWDGKHYQVISGEGGNTDFAPNTEQEIALLRFLMQKYPEHVCYERVLSGTGLINLYEFLKTENAALINPQTEQQLLTSDPAAVISQLGMGGEDELCQQALTLFCKVYGAEAANLALKCLPHSGVILAGGIAAKILPFIQQGAFMQGFLAKGRYRGVLEAIPVKICTNPEAALFGALVYAQKL